MLALRACPVCGSADLRPLFQWNDNSCDTTFFVETCNACTVAFVNPQPTWEELQPYYTESYWPYQPPNAEELASILKVALQTREYDRIKLNSSDSVLEIGPGSGRFLLAAQHVCRSAIGVEPSPAATKILRAQGCNIHNSHFEEFARSYVGEKFSLVVMSHVLEHLPQPVDTLRQIKSVMGSDSVLLMRMPNAGSWAFQVVKGEWMGTDLPRHLIHWNERALTTLAQRTGMKIVKATYDSPPGIVAQAMTARARFGFKIPDRIVWLAPKLIDRIAARLSQRWITPATAMNIEVHLQAADWSCPRICRSMPNLSPP